MSLNRVLPDPTDPVFAALNAQTPGSQFWNGEVGAWNTAANGVQGATQLTQLTVEQTYLTAVIAGYQGLGYGGGPGVAKYTVPASSPTSVPAGSPGAVGQVPTVASAAVNTVNTFGTGSPWLQAAIMRLADVTLSIAAANATAGRF